MIDSNEDFESIKSKLSWAYGLADPTIILNGMLITSDAVLDQARPLEGKSLFITDQRLARPIKVTIRLETNNKNGNESTPASE